ncbi:hypothetical protein ESA_03210 [Cronobacter sakazakii ATCC BAA-894]|uniref:Uncharacterized protein n=1 Tax=Cronobacter sakazakii (strain ATCC BAA-894) TaxID=290339 RepID=A7MGN9_CROS8|nr:hypothetical protein ESA_03210 [Cronobacter sakazakii ATCC BAA-894]
MMGVAPGRLNPFLCSACKVLIFNTCSCGDKKGFQALKSKNLFSIQAFR